MIGEKAEDAIIRELKEETGLEFKILKFGGVTENFFTNLRNQKTHGIDFYYYVGLKNSSDNYDRLDLNFVENGKIEHHYSWIPIDNINNFNILPSVIKNSINLDGGLFHYTIDE